MALEALARQSLGYFISAYGELYKGEAIKPEELESLIWGRMMATSAGMANTGVIIPYENIKRAKVTLPYLPDQINYTGCPAIKKNGGLYTPCCGKLDGAFCKGCTVDKKGAPKELEYGIVEERDDNIASGKIKPVTYGDWLKSHKKTSLSDVYDKLRTSGISIEIPAAELQESDKRRKGRPGKAEPVDEDGPVVKKRGRKIKKAEESDDESISSKSASSKGSNVSKSKANKAELSGSDSDEESKPKKEKKVKKVKVPSAELSAESGSDEEPKKKEKKVKAKEPSAEPWAEPKEKKEKKEKAEKAPKEKKEKKAEKAPKEKKEKKEKKAPEVVKAESESEDEAEFEAEFELKDGDEVVTVDGVKVVLREENGTQHLLNTAGLIVGHIDEDGDAVWN